MAESHTSERASVSSEGSASRYMLRSQCRGIESHFETPNKHRSRHSSVMHIGCNHDHSHDHYLDHQHNHEHVLNYQQQQSQAAVTSMAEQHFESTTGTQNSSLVQYGEEASQQEASGLNEEYILQAGNSRATRSSVRRSEAQMVTTTTEISRLSSSSSTVHSSGSMTHRKCCIDERFDVEPKTDYTYAHSTAYRSGSDRMRVPEPNLCRPRIGSSLSARNVLEDSVHSESCVTRHETNGSSSLLHLERARLDFGESAQSDQNALTNASTTTTRLTRLAIDEGYQPLASRNGRLAAAQRVDGMATRRSSRLTKKQVESALAAGADHASAYDRLTATGTRTDSAANWYQGKAVSLESQHSRWRLIEWISYGWLLSVVHFFSRVLVATAMLLTTPLRAIAKAMGNAFGFRRTGVLTGFSETVSTVSMTTTTTHDVLRRNRKRLAVCCGWWWPAAFATALLLAFAIASYGADTESVSSVDGDSFWHTQWSLLKRTGSRFHGWMLGLWASLRDYGSNIWIVHGDTEAIVTGTSVAGAVPCCNCESKVREQVGALREELLKHLDLSIKEKLAVVNVGGGTSVNSGELHGLVDDLVQKRVAILREQLQNETVQANETHESELAALRKQLVAEWSTWTDTELLKRLSEVNASLASSTQQYATALNESITLLVADRLAAIVTQLDSKLADERTHAADLAKYQQDAMDTRIVSQFDQLESALKGRLDALIEQASVSAANTATATATAANQLEAIRADWLLVQEELLKFREALSATDKERQATLDDRIAELKLAFETWTAAQSSIAMTANSQVELDSSEGLVALRNQLSQLELLIQKGDDSLRRELDSTRLSFDVVARGHKSLENAVEKLNAREQITEETTVAWRAGVEASVTEQERVTQAQISKLSDELSTMAAHSQEALVAAQASFATELSQLRNELRSAANLRERENTEGVDEATRIAQLAELTARVASVSDSIEKRLVDVLEGTAALNRRVDQLHTEQENLDGSIQKNKEEHQTFIALINEKMQNTNKAEPMKLDEATLEYIRLLVWRLVAQELEIFKNDQTNRTDYALESGGGSVVSTGCTKLYQHDTGVFTVFGFPVWYRENSPRRVIAGNTVKPGECWSFAGSTGELYVQLSRTVHVTAITYEHLPRALSPDLALASAPREIAAYAFETDAFNKVEPIPLGNFTFDQYGSSLQTFTLTRSPRPVRFVQLRVLSNHGRKEFTCLYRFRVHGDLPDRLP